MGEFLSNDFMEYCKEHGIQHQLTCPETSQQNGVAERKLPHLTLFCLSWLHAGSLPRELWASAFQTACHVVNRQPPWSGTKLSPFELFIIVNPMWVIFIFLGLFVMFMYWSIIELNLTQRPRNAFVGYDTHRKGWRCMDLETKKVIVSRDVVFNEISSYKDDAHYKKQWIQ